MTRSFISVRAGLLLPYRPAPFQRAPEGPAPDKCHRNGGYDCIHDFIDDVADIRPGSGSSGRDAPYRIPAVYLDGDIRFIRMIYHPHLGTCGDDDNQRCNQPDYPGIVSFSFHSHRAFHTLSPHSRLERMF